MTLKHEDVSLLNSMGHWEGSFCCTCQLCSSCVLEVAVPYHSKALSWQCTSVYPVMTSTFNWNDVPVQHIAVAGGIGTWHAIVQSWPNHAC